MSLSVVLASGLAGAAVVAWSGSSGVLARRRLACATPVPPRLEGLRKPSHPEARATGREARGSATGRQSRGLAVVGALVVGLAVVSGTVSDPVVVGGAVAALGGTAWLRRERAAAAVRRGRAAVAAGLPTAADLLAASLGSGATVADALAVVADAGIGPVGARLRPVAAALLLGASPAEAWGAVGPDDPLGPLARACIRAAETGAPLAETVAGVADDERHAQRWQADVAARRAGVLAVGPLAACFLPAFVLLGIVPVVLAVAQAALVGLR